MKRFNISNEYKHELPYSFIYDDGGKNNVIYACLIPFGKKTKLSADDIEALGSVNNFNDFNAIIGGLDDYEEVSDNLKECAVRQLLAGEEVIISCDIRQQANKLLGILDTEFNEFKTDEIKPTRYLVLDGVHIENGEAVRFKAQDTSGGNTGADGHYMMSADWFDKYVLTAVIKKDYLD